MKPLPKIIERILEEVRQHQRFCVVGHVRPDGDCIGSQIGLTLALRNQGKEVKCWNQDKVPLKYAFLNAQKVMQQPEEGEEFDCVISVDAASYERLGTVVDFIKERKVFINIDHHPSNTKFADINWVSAKSPSSGELVYQLIDGAEWPIPPKIADCLYTAISTDTGSFQYPTTQPETYQIAGELVEKGANIARICDEVYQSYSLSRVRLLKHVYNHFRLVHDNRIAYFWIKLQDLAATGADSADVEGLIDHIRDIDPVIVACMFEESDPGVVRLSLRSKHKNVNVSEIAEKFGGGGHKSAAGARLTGSYQSVQRKVVRAIKDAIDKAVEPNNGAS